MVLSFCNKNEKGIDEQIVINNVFGQCNYSKKPDYKATYFSLNEFFKKMLYILQVKLGLSFCIS